MILRSQPRMFAPGTVLTKLPRVLRGVVRVLMRTGADYNVTCTGWFVTSRLIAVARAGLPHAGDYELRFDAWDGSRVAWSAMTSQFIAAGPPEGIAIVALREPAEDRALEIRLAPPQPDEPVCMLHFAGGRDAAQLSFGSVLRLESDTITIDADTEAGSSGAPLLDREFRVIGVHFRRDRQGNQSHAWTHLIHVLRDSPHWPEIAQAHGLADPRAAIQHLQTERTDVSATTLRRAAVFASLPRAEMSDNVAGWLAPYVVDARAARWVLRASVRRRVLEEARSLDVLRDARGELTPRDRLGDDMQDAIDRILWGPPYDFASLSEAALAASLQVVHWFGALLPELPTAAALALQLARRRVRSRLESIAGRGFVGRGRELAEMSAWFAANDGPLSITGIGGIGKSSLIAKLGLARPAETVLLWLDFDRADLAADRGESVLAALLEQIAVQLERLDLDPADPRTAGALGEQLAARTAGGPAPLLVLDSFEVAQHSARYQELWPVLERIVAAAPALRVVVSGRAPVAELQLAGKPAHALRLGGLDDTDVRAWLDSLGLRDPAAVAEVVALSGGIPLILRLATELVQRGGPLDIARDLPQRIIDGMLYERILDRVVDPELRHVATAMIVLRRLTRAMVEPVLQPVVELPARPIDQWFADLGRELGLVVLGGDVLQLRHEVRSAALGLLERDRADLVAEIDRRAAAYYASQPADEPELAAELVYHRLRLGDLDGAAAAWRDGCRGFLQDACDALPQPGRGWLADRLGGARSAGGVSLESWELDAAERIRDALDRGLGDSVAPAILDERTERSPGGPLAFYDAYLAFCRGDLATARRVVDAGLDVPPALIVQLADRNSRLSLLKALVLARTNETDAADLLLSSFDDRLEIGDSLAIDAARLALTVRLDDEVSLLQADPVSVRSLLAPIDVCLPRLADQLDPLGIKPRRAPRPQFADLLPRGLANRVDELRRDTLPDEPAGVRQARRQERPELALTMPDDPRARRALRIALNGWRRWRLLAKRPFLALAPALVARWIATSDPLGEATLGTLAVMAAAVDRLAEDVHVLMSQLRFLRIDPRWKQLAATVLRIGLHEPDYRWVAAFLEQPGSELDLTSLLRMPPSASGVATFLFAADPLETIVHRVARGTSWSTR